MNTLGAILLPAWVAISVLVFLAHWLDSLTFLPAYFTALSEWHNPGMMRFLLNLASNACEIVASGLCIAGAARLGGPLVGVFRPDWRGRSIEKDLIGAALGLTIASLFWAGTGMAGLYFPGTATVFLLVLGTAGVWHVWTRRWVKRGQVKVLLCLGSLALVVLPCALVPEHEIDSLIYHLAMPAEYVLNHKMIGRPDLYYSSYTLGQEMLSVPCMLLGAESSAKLISLWSALLSAVCVLAILRKYVSAGYALIACAVLFASPPLLIAASRSKNDSILVFLSSAVLLARLGKGIPSAILAGALAGAACNFKITGLILLVALLGSFVIEKDRRARKILVCAAAALIPILPWVIRNWLNLAAPLAPVMLAMSSLSTWTPVNSATAHSYLFEWRDIKPSGIVDWLQAFLLTFGKQNAFVLLALPVIIAGRRVRAEMPSLLLFSAFFLAVWLAVLPWHSRFLLPVLPALVIMGMISVSEVDTGRTARIIGAATLGWFSVIAGAGIFLGISGRDGSPLRVFLGAESRDRYSSRVLGNYWEAVSAVRLYADDGKKTLAVGEWRSYPASGKLIARGIESTPAVWELAHGSIDERRIGIRLRQMNVGYLLYNLSNANYWAHYFRPFPWSEHGTEIYSSYWDGHAQMLWHSGKQDSRHGYFILYGLKAGGTRRPFRAWLPGTESEYFNVRKAAVGVPDAAALDREFSLLEKRFGRRAEYLARLSLASFFLERWDRMGKYAIMASAGVPEAAEMYSAWGAVSLSRAGVQDRSFIGYFRGRLEGMGGYLSLLFNLGISPLVLRD